MKLNYYFILSRMPATSVTASYVRRMREYMEMSQKYQENYCNTYDGPFPSILQFDKYSFEYIYIYAIVYFLVLIIYFFMTNG